MLLRNAVSKKDYEQIKKLYVTAFPKEERAPFFLLKRKAMHQKGTFLMVEEDHVFLGFLHVILADKLLYLMFFAMQDACRNQGYGSQALHLLQERYKDKHILIAREKIDPAAKDHALRKRRRSFYQRNGFQDLPCSIIEAGVAYDSMSTGPVSPEEYNTLMKAWSSPMLARIVGLKMIPQKKNGSRS